MLDAVAVSNNRVRVFALVRHSLSWCSETCSWEVVVNRVSQSGELTLSKVGLIITLSVLFA